jgi:hypothetical protein
MPMLNKQTDMYLNISLVMVKAEAYLCEIAVPGSAMNCAFLSKEKLESIPD